MHIRSRAEFECASTFYCDTVIYTAKTAQQFWRFSSRIKHLNTVYNFSRNIPFVRVLDKIRK